MSPMALKRTTRMSGAAGRSWFTGENVGEKREE
jgi:hypothetical protein